MNIMTTISLLKKPGKHQIMRVTFCQNTPLTKIHKSLSKTSSRLDGTALSSISLSQQRYLSLGSRIQQYITYPERSPAHFPTNEINVVEDEGDNGNWNSWILPAHNNGLNNWKAEDVIS